MHTVYLGGGAGHPRGVAAAGGDPTKPSVAGITVFERADGEVFWANDSQSLPRRLSPQETDAVQRGLEAKYSGRHVRQLVRITDVPMQ